VTSWQGKPVDLAVSVRFSYEAVNMTAKLVNCSKEEQQSVTSFLWAEGVPGGEIHQCMCAMYGNSAVSHIVVYEWIEMFKNGHMSVTDAELSGCPTAAKTAQNEERARELILQNGRVTVDETAKQLNISIGSAYLVVDNLQVHKVCVRWALKVLMDEHKRMCIDIYSRHLTCNCEEGDNFLL
jgi:hypothetical protein